MQEFVKHADVFSGKRVPGRGNFSPNWWRARIRPKPDRAMRAVPSGRLPPARSGTPPCKSGQLKKDLGLEVSSARQAARLIIFEFMRSFFVGSNASVACVENCQRIAQCSFRIFLLAFAFSGNAKDAVLDLLP
jgi:hypothetical protein